VEKLQADKKFCCHEGMTEKWRHENNQKG